MNNLSKFCAWQPALYCSIDISIGIMLLLSVKVVDDCLPKTQTHVLIMFPCSSRPLIHSFTNSQYESPPHGKYTGLQVQGQLALQSIGAAKIQAESIACNAGVS